MKISSDSEQMAVELYLQGHSISAIARELSLSVANVTRVVERAAKDWKTSFRGKTADENITRKLAELAYLKQMCYSLLMTAREFQDLGSATRSIQNILKVIEQEVSILGLKQTQDTTDINFLCEAFIELQRIKALEAKKKN
jgi:transposase-like protein